MFSQEADFSFKIVAVGWMSPRQPCADDADLCSGGLDGYAGFQAANDGQRIAPAIGLITKRKGRIEIDVASGSEYRSEIERRR